MLHTIAEINRFRTPRNYELNSRSYTGRLTKTVLLFWRHVDPEMSKYSHISSEN